MKIKISGILLYYFDRRLGSLSKPKWMKLWSIAMLVLGQIYKSGKSCSISSSPDENLAWNAVDLSLFYCLFN
jgi:hypothetical protein